MLGTDPRSFNVFLYLSTVWSHPAHTLGARCRNLLHGSEVAWMFSQIHSVKFGTRKRRPDSDRIPTGFSWDPAWIFSVWPFDDMRQSLLSTFIDTCRHVRDCLRWFVRVIWWKHQTPNLWSLSGALSATCPVQPVQRCRIWHFLLGVTLLRAALGWTRSENRVETDSDLICRFLISVTTWCNGAVFS